jgi:regulation of enolase protein 1 (concanavalin A-like superfamily)
LDDGRLEVVTDARTDFWRETHYGFTRDNGHFFGCEVAGDFTAQLRVRARCETLYDQAGVMVRLDARNWIKAGIEQSDGQALLSSVLTADRSDWATGVYGGDPTDVWMRVTVSDGVVRLQASSDGRRWPLARLAPFPKAASYLARADVLHARAIRLGGGVLRLRGRASAGQRAARPFLIAASASNGEPRDVRVAGSV